VIVADEADLHIYDERGKKRRKLAKFERKGLAAGAKPVRVPNAGERRVVLSLAPQDALRTTINLPLAAENNLAQVVGFEIDRLTPFKTEQVYYDAKVIDRQPANRTLQASLGIVPRAILAAILSQVQLIGLVPEAVVIEGDSSKLNLLPASKQRRRLNSAQRWRRVLLFLVFLTALAWAVLPLWQQRNVVIQLLPLVDTAEQQAQLALALRERLDTAVESSQFLIEKRRQSVLMVDVLHELTGLLPDSTYLEQLSLRNGEVEMRGQSAEATALISLLEDSELFEQAAFRSPVVKDNRTGRDRFVLTANITPGFVHIPIDLATAAEENQAVEEAAELQADSEIPVEPESGLGQSAPEPAQNMEQTRVN
jgi:general secretion pathway protein L